jgi:hypothetical protein
MKILATLLLSIALPGTSVQSLNRTPVDHKTAKQEHKGGKWYFADSGHAIYCYGPVMIVNQPDGNLQRVATFCRDGQTMVPLKD